MNAIITLGNVDVYLGTKYTHLGVPACSIDRHFGLDSEPTPPPDADTGVGQGAPPMTTLPEDEQATSSSGAVDDEDQGRPTFKMVYVGDGGTGKISGDELMALAPGTLLASWRQAQDEAGAEEADKEVDVIMCASFDEEEGSCPEVSKGGSQNGQPDDSRHHVISCGAVQHGSSAGVVMDGSASDEEEVQPGLAEETVVTHRDILLRAVKQRKRNTAERNIGIDCVPDSQKVNT